MSKRVDFYYDFSCPYAYLASTQVEAVASRQGADLVLKPILLGGVFKHWNRSQAPDGGMTPPKARHNLWDMKRWAAYHKVPLNIPNAHPMRTVSALRFLLSAPRDQWWPLTVALYRAYWVDGQDIRDPEVLRQIGVGLGLDEHIVDGIGLQAVKSELRARTDEAVGRGIFGVPTFWVSASDQAPIMFWGQDRLTFVELALEGRTFASAAELEGFP